MQPPPTERHLLPIPPRTTVGHRVVYSAAHSPLWLVNVARVALIRNWLDPVVLSLLRALAVRVKVHVVPDSTLFRAKLGNAAGAW